MARPRKKGLDYFPHDTDANSHDKMRALKSLHGIAGCGAYWELVEKIYRSENGYLEVDQDWKFRVLADDMRVDVQEFHKMLDSMLDIGLFQRFSYEKSHRLTSDGLIKRREDLLYHRNYVRDARGKKDPMTPAQEKGLAGKLAGEYPETAIYRAKQALSK